MEELAILTHPHRTSRCPHCGYERPIILRQYRDGDKVFAIARPSSCPNRGKHNVDKKQPIQSRFRVTVALNRIHKTLDSSLARAQTLRPNAKLLGVLIGPNVSPEVFAKFKEWTDARGLYIKTEPWLAANKEYNIRHHEFFSFVFVPEKWELDAPPAQDLVWGATVKSRYNQKVRAVAQARKNGTLITLDKKPNP